MGFVFLNASELLSLCPLSVYEEHSLEDWAGNYGGIGVRPRIQKRVLVEGDPGPEGQRAKGLEG